MVQLRWILKNLHDPNYLRLLDFRNCGTIESQGHAGLLVSTVAMQHYMIRLTEDLSKHVVCYELVTHERVLFATHALNRHQTIFKPLLSSSMVRPEPATDFVSTCSLTLSQCSQQQPPRHKGNLFELAEPSATILRRLLTFIKCR